MSEDASSDVATDFGQLKDVSSRTGHRCRCAEQPTRTSLSNRRAERNLKLNEVDLTSAGYRHGKNLGGRFTLPDSGAQDGRLSRFKERKPH